MAFLMLSSPALQLRYKDPGMKQYWPSSTISPESAEARADMGKAADFWQMQVFDGPAPETINGRMAMLGECFDTFKLPVHTVNEDDMVSFRMCRP
jgi:hypothetical protein